MDPKAGYSTPLLHVRSLETSISFYQRLGFEVLDTDRCTPFGWARLHCEGGAIMLLRAEKQIDPRVQGVLFYLYTPDLKALRDHLIAGGVKPSEIACPPYMPSGEIRLDDPDGYCVLVGHWGKPEHDEWLKRIGRASTP